MPFWAVGFNLFNLEVGVKKLSSAQEAALIKMSITEWKSAYEIGASIATLDALVRKGKARKSTGGGLGMMFSPRTAAKYIAIHNHTE